MCISYYSKRDGESVALLFPSIDYKGHLTAAGATVTVPTRDGSWIRMDQQPGTEHFVLLASTVSLPELETETRELPTQRFEGVLQRVGRDLRPSGLWRVAVADGIGLSARVGSGPVAILERVALSHQ